MNVNELLESGCGRETKEKVCRARGGESCAFDGAMIVLQPIADTAHLVHGPIACCGNSWKGRGTRSSKGELYRMGFTTDMSEMDIIYGSEEKLFNAIIRTCEAVRPKAIFVYATCVSGLIGEEIEPVCKKAEAVLNSGRYREPGSVNGTRVIPVNAPGFVGPKNLGNRIAGEVLLDYVIGSGEPAVTTDYDINLIGEYNIAGDLWIVEPLLRDAGIRVLSRITGNATFEEITYAQRAKLNVVVCSRALINIAKSMERRYGIPYIEVSFFGRTEMTKALRAICSKLAEGGINPGCTLSDRVESLIERKEERLSQGLKRYGHLRGKRAVLYTGGVKSWSIISALLDLGIEIVAVGTRKSTFEDEEKMKEIFRRRVSHKSLETLRDGSDALLIEDVTPANLRRLMKERRADILIAGGRNQYLAMKEGFPFVDVNQERVTAYAGYEGLLNLAEQISNSIGFFAMNNGQRAKSITPEMEHIPHAQCSMSYANKKRDVIINPLKHSRSIGAAIALQGIHRALPVIHGAQGCNFLAKVLITKHFREPVALASTKLFTEDVVMGSEDNLTGVLEGTIEKQGPALIGVLTSGLSEVRGDDVAGVVRNLGIQTPGLKIVHISTPDYEGGLETGYAKAVEAVLDITGDTAKNYRIPEKGQINLLVGSHLTPADFTELREMIEAFGLKPVILPDLAALDGSRQGFSALAVGGTRTGEIEAMGRSEFTISVGLSMESPARLLKDRFGIEYTVLESISGLRGADSLMDTLSALSGRAVPPGYERQRRSLIDGMRDAHFYYGGKRVCLALEPDLSVQTSMWLEEMGAGVELAVIPAGSTSAQRIYARSIVVGDLFSIEGDFDILIANSHGEDTAKRLGVPLYQMGFPVYGILGSNSRITMGYRGTLMLINEIANILKG